MFNRFLALVSILMLSGCAGLLNATITGQGYNVHHDVAYGDNTRQKLDIYVPDDLSARTPVVLFIYGGAWKAGSKNIYLFAGQALASRGYIAVVADYRLYPEVTFPGFIEDNAKAFRFVHDNIASYGGDVRNIYLAGHSAGAFNAMMLTANPKYLKAAGANVNQVRGTIGLAGPYDFLPLTDPDIIPVFNDERNDPATQPIHFMDHKLPPVFVATGDADDQVQPRNSINVAARLDQLHSPNELHIYPDVAHIGIILSLAEGFRSKAPLLDDIDHFIQSTRVDDENSQSLQTR